MDNALVCIHTCMSLFSTVLALLGLISGVQHNRTTKLKISELLLHNPGQYCFLATLQACFVHVCSVCVCVGVRLHVCTYVCT